LIEGGYASDGAFGHKKLRQELEALEQRLGAAMC
jgi:hypothetical protein